MSKRAERDRPAISDETREKLENAFRDWLAANAHALELGGTGDVYELVLALNAAKQNS